MSMSKVVTMDFTSPVNNLNDDCLLYIFKRVSFADRLRVELVCKKWRNLCTLLWQKTCLFNATDKQFQNIGNNNESHNVEMSKIIFLKCHRYLTRVNLSKSPEFSHVLSTDAGHNCPVSFYECGFGSPPKGSLNYFKKVLSTCENVEDLALCQCVLEVDDKYLENLFKNNRKLRSVVLSGYQLKGKFFAHLSVETIASIVLRKCEMNLKFFDSVVSHAPNLRAIQFTRPNDLVGSYFRIQPLTPTNLLQLSVEDHYYPFRHISDIYKLKGLLSLKLKLRNLKDSMLKLISENCTQLRQLDVEDNGELTDLSLRYIGSLPHLKCLAVSYNRHFTDAGLQTLKVSLRELDVRVTLFSADGLLSLIKRMQGLEQLNVSRLTHLDNSFVQPVTDIVKSRSDRTSLTIRIFNTSIEPLKITSISPLVKWVDDDRLEMNHEKYV